MGRSGSRGNGFGGAGNGGNGGGNGNGNGGRPNEYGGWDRRQGGGGSMQDKVETTFNVPSTKCGIIIGKGQCFYYNNFFVIIYLFIHSFFQ